MEYKRFFSYSRFQLLNFELIARKETLTTKRIFTEEERKR